MTRRFRIQEIKRERDRLLAYSKTGNRSFAFELAVREDAEKRITLLENLPEPGGASKIIKNLKQDDIQKDN